MTLSFFKPSRCVLLIGDEALHVFDVTARSTQLIDSVPWQTEGFDETVVDLIRRECGGKSVLILNDMTDQHFKGGQRLPKVGAMDRANVLARKLQVAFPSYPILGALAVKPDENSSVDKQKGAVYLFAGINMSEPIARTMEVAKKSLAPISGFYLLPVEASDMVKTLSAKLTARGSKPARWVIFMGQHRSGALRQVITRDGQLAMTRMTPVADNLPDFAAWAQDAFQEFKATVGYLSRFGFAPEDGVDVIFISQPQVGKAFEQLLDISCRYSTFTAPEAARELGLTIGAQGDPHYADILHAAWIGHKSRFILPMKAEELSKISQPRRLAMAGMLLLLAGAGYFGYQNWTQLQSISDTNGHIATQNRALKQTNDDLAAEEAKMKAMGFDVKLVQGASKTFKDLEAGRIHELGMIQKIHEALGDNMRLDELVIDDIAAATTPGAPPPAPLTTPTMSTPLAKGGVDAAASAPMLAELKLSFPPTIQIEVGVREINNLKRRLEAALPGCVVTVKKNVAGLEYSDTFSGEASSTDKADKTQQYVADLTIKGAVP